MPKPRGAQPTPNPTALPVKAIRGHLVAAADGLWAWYRLSPVSWDFTSDGHRQSVLAQQTQRWAALAGHTCQIRITSHPVPTSAWAARLDRDAPPAVDPAVWDARDAYLATTQHRIASGGFTWPVVFVGVRVTARQVHPGKLALLLGDTPAGDLDKTRAQLVRIDASMARDGFRASPATSRAIAWLIHASLAPTLPVSAHALAGPEDGWEPDDIATLGDQVETTAAPFSPTVHVQAMREGRALDEYVTVLTAGRMDERDPLDPGCVPWLAGVQDFGFPVEVTARFDVIPGHQMTTRADVQLRKSLDMDAGFREHGEEPPPSTARAIEDARRVQDEVSTGNRESATRLRGVIRLAMVGATPEETAERAALVTEHYATTHRIALSTTKAQHAMLGEFLPCAPTRVAGFERQMPAVFAAAAVPNAGTELGTPGGPYLGYSTSGHPTPVFFDPTDAARHQQSGLTVALGSPGAGKTTMAAAVAANAALWGVPALILDPSGRLEPLTRLPRWNGSARHIDLAGAQPGVLNPWTLIPDPRRDDHPDHESYGMAVAAAAAERKQLAVDAFRGLLPWRMVAAEVGDYTRAIITAVGKVGGGTGGDPWDVIHELAVMGKGTVGPDLAGLLTEQAELPGGRLLFPARADDSKPTTIWQQTGRAAAPDLFTGSPLTVLSMSGLTLPAEGTDPAHWTHRERIDHLVMSLVTRLAIRFMYSSRGSKQIVLDEIALASIGKGSFVAMFKRLAADSRKWGAGVTACGQNTAHFRDVVDQLSNLTSTVLIGRMEDAATATDALEMAQLPTRHGYQHILTAFPPGQGHFLMRDRQGRAGTIRVDLAADPQLAAALDSNPDGPAAVDAPAGMLHEIGAAR